MPVRKRTAEIRMLRPRDVKRHELDIAVRLKMQSGLAGGSGAARAKDDAVLRVGDVRGALYLLEGVDALEPVQKKRQVACLVECFDDEMDFLVRHVELNCRQHAINPLLIREISRTLDRARNKTLSGVCRGTVYQKFLDLEGLGEGAARILGDLCAFLGQKLTHFDLPYHIPHMIASRGEDEQEQEDLARAVDELVRHGGPVSDTKFAWPAPEQVETMFDHAEYGDDYSDDHNHGDNDSEPLSARDGKILKTPRGERAKRGSVKKLAPIVKREPHLVVIPATDRHPPYVVNTKTNRVSIVEDKHGVTVLQDVTEGGKKSNTSTCWIFPPACRTFLNPKSDADVGVILSDNKAELDVLYQKNPGARCVVFFVK